MPILLSHLNCDIVQLIYNLLTLIDLAASHHGPLVQIIVINVIYSAKLQYLSLICYTSYRLFPVFF